MLWILIAAKYFYYFISICRSSTFERSFWSDLIVLYCNCSLKNRSWHWEIFFFQKNKINRFCWLVFCFNSEPICSWNLFEFCYRSLIFFLSFFLFFFWRHFLSIRHAHFKQTFNLSGQSIFSPNSETEIGTET